MPAPTNSFKSRLRQGSPQRGLLSTLNSTAVIEMLAGWDFDWILIDTEHTPTEVADVVAQLQVLDAHDVSAIVRPAWSDMVLIKRLLDAGAQTFLIPGIDTAEEAAAAVSYTRYPPAGVRGVSGTSRAARYGQTKDYLQTAGNQICILAQIETATGLANLEEIAAVPGVDAVFIGPADLAASLGHLGNPQTLLFRPPSMTPSAGCGRSASPADTSRSTSRKPVCASPRASTWSASPRTPRSSTAGSPSRLRVCRPCLTHRRPPTGFPRAEGAGWFGTGRMPCARHRGDILTARAP
jgi:4-hydroxy-2-oxoheptanedioate aldolase